MLLFLLHFLNLCIFFLFSHLILEEETRSGSIRPVKFGHDPAGRGVAVEITADNSNRVFEQHSLDEIPEFKNAAESDFGGRGGVEFFKQGQKVAGRRVGSGLDLPERFENQLVPRFGVVVTWRFRLALSGGHRSLVKKAIRRLATPGSDHGQTVHFHVRAANPGGRQ
jgi:hypothetical protein